MACLTILVISSSTLIINSHKFTENSDTEDESVASTSEKRQIKLFEQGPRMDLKLVKIENGVLGGEVMFHEYKQKTKQEQLETKQRIEKRDLEKKQRREQQERNVEAKKLKKAGKEETILEGESSSEEEVDSDYEKDYELQEFEQADDEQSDENDSDNNEQIEE